LAPGPPPGSSRDGAGAFPDLQYWDSFPPPNFPSEILITRNAPMLVSMSPTLKNPTGPLSALLTSAERDHGVAAHKSSKSTGCSNYEERSQSRLCSILVVALPPVVPNLRIQGDGRNLISCRGLSYPRGPDGMSRIYLGRNAPSTLAKRMSPWPAQCQRPCWWKCRRLGLVLVTN